MRLSIPIRAVLVLNGREHWGARQRRVKMERETTHVIWLIEKPAIALPCKVTLTRVAPRPLDSHDNLAASLKAVVDQLAIELGLPVNAKGHAQDSDPRVSWAYAQRKGGVREYAVEVEVVQVKELSQVVPRATSEGAP